MMQLITAAEDRVSLRRPGCAGSQLVVSGRVVDEGIVEFRVQGIVEFRVHGTQHETVL